MTSTGTGLSGARCVSEAKTGAYIEYECPDRGTNGLIRQGIEQDSPKKGYGKKNIVR